MKPLTIEARGTFDAQYAWVGLFWDRRRVSGRESLIIEVCPVPFFVLHLSFKYGQPE